MLQITETQALQLLTYLSNSNPCDVSETVRRTLIETSDALMWDIAEQLNIDWNEVSVNPITLKIEKI